MFWMINIVGVAIAIYFVDLESNSVIQSVISPIVIAVLSLAIIIKLFINSKAQSASYMSNSGNGAHSGSPFIYGSEKNKPSGESDHSSDSSSPSPSSSFGDSGGGGGE
ncbi:MULTISPECIES: hypothetical protein [Pseudoalteromonas]|uniref:Uncharacterized protein n=1 Tax=Pseudoalteromonas luteoviolacea (strain 2ta16) TaxID=1353533 RepID=V4HSE4_PSEL2|nr:MULTISPECIES: hypothetical protein [Pseudoalteromonas]ESP90824.1 hypothetical protein PL2TA16_01215 [Pseudoalteromonas luteoviolacea 2ta16]KZN38418.1 hypothetical protein N483_20895 [Pseudoalteromonas luteoviolacea NCIMB 1944]MCG7547846.1 hypothetical protein [Pseudoalteromonas sp. Of7M-16]